MVKRLESRNMKSPMAKIARNAKKIKRTKKIKKIKKKTKQAKEKRRAKRIKTKKKLIGQKSRLARVKDKPKIAIFDFTGCDGDQTSILSLEDELLDLMSLVDITNFRLARARKDDGPYDVAFVEGGICRRDEIERIIKIRKKSKLLVALGACACYGGPQAAKTKMVASFVEKRVYSKTDHLDSIEPAGLDKYVKVDFYIRGCPIDKYDFLNFVKQILVGKMPLQNNNCVCIECKFNQNVCLFDKKSQCLGPLTYGGCNAVCPTNNQPCTGCRGFIDDLNLKAHIELLKKLGFSKKEIEDMFNVYATTSKNINEVSKILEED